MNKYVKTLTYFILQVKQKTIGWKKSCQSYIENQIKDKEM